MLGFPGTTTDEWANADDQLVATALEMLDEINERVNQDGS